MHVSRPHEYKALYEVVVEKGDFQFKNMNERLRLIKEHVLKIMTGGQMEHRNPAWLRLEEIHQEVLGGMIYRWMCGRGAHAT